MKTVEDLINALQYFPPETQLHTGLIIVYNHHEKTVRIEDPCDAFIGVNEFTYLVE